MRVRALASTWASFPVNLLRQRVFAPFIIAIVVSLSDQASHPYVSNEQIATLYIFSFRLGDIFESNTCRSAPMRCIARAIRRFMSFSSLPSAEKIDPRYLKL